MVPKRRAVLQGYAAAARVAQVDDIAPLVAFLCTDDTKWVTGAALCVNGGLYN